MTSKRQDVGDECEDLMGKGLDACCHTDQVI
jgi:hypothetical protein